LGEKNANAEVRVVEVGRHEARSLHGRLPLVKSGPSCFPAGTLLLTPEGVKPIEEFQRGDLLLSRSEWDLEGAIEAKAVVEVFIRRGSIMRLLVAGQEIRTTAEHPFWVKAKGWTPAGMLKVGDLLASHNGLWHRVQELQDRGES